MKKNHCTVLLKSGKPCKYEGKYLRVESGKNRGHVCGVHAGVTITFKKRQPKKRQPRAAS